MNILVRKKIVFWITLSTLVCSLSPSVSAAAKDDPLISMVMVDQLEWRDDDQYIFEAQGWIGKDLSKLWLKTEVERVDSETEEAEVQLLYGQAVSPYWDFQFGLRQDFKPTPDRRWVVLGFQGLSPYFFEVDTALFIGERGRLGLRLEAEYELMITQRLVISPEIEVNLYSKNDEETGSGASLADMELGLRMRYEICREFAPYIGVNWNGAFGNTADFAKLEGEDTHDTQLVLGIHAWF